MVDWSPVDAELFNGRIAYAIANYRSATSSSLQRATVERANRITVLWATRESEFNVLTEGYGQGFWS